MADVNIYKGGVAGFPANALGRVNVVEYELDTTVQNLATADTYDIIYLPAGSLVLAVAVTVVTAEGATATAGIGDSAAATTFLTACNCNSAATTLSAATTAKYYAAADAIRVTPNHAMDAAKLQVKAIIVDASWHGNQ